MTMDAPVIRKATRQEVAEHGRKLRRAGRVLQLPRAEMDERFHPEPHFAHQRKSAADPYEAVRLRAALQAIVSREPDIWASALSVTIADPRNALPVGALHKLQPSKIIRPVAEGLDRLQSYEGPVRAILVLEVNARRDRAGRVRWIPHAHGIIAGFSRDELKEAFSPLPKRALHLTAVNQIAGLVKYVTKVEPQLRVEYINKDGEKGSSLNKIPVEMELEWLKCMSERQITRLVKFVGFNVKQQTWLRTAELDWPRNINSSVGV